MAEEIKAPIDIANDFVLQIMTNLMDEKKTHTEKGRLAVEYDRVLKGASIIVAIENTKMRSRQLRLDNKDIQRKMEKK